MNIKELNPIWPEVTIFWGAGATASLGFPTTNQQGKNLKLLAEDIDLDTRLNKIEMFKYIKSDLKKLLICLGDNLDSLLGEIKDEEYESFVSLLKKAGINIINEKNVKDRIIYLRLNYDWDALKRIIKITNRENFLQNLFNIIDLNFISGKGIYVYDKNGQKHFLHHYRLKGARNCLIFLIQLMIASAYLKIIREDKEKLIPYIKFAEVLAELMTKEGLSYSKIPFHLRDFYLFSYAIISMNYDPLLLWLIFNAHKKYNQKNILISPTLSPTVSLKLYNDLGNVVASYKIDNNINISKNFWYTFHESVAQRINDRKYLSNILVRIGKFYFPHGNCLMRECPNCGKIMMIFGDKWDYFSDSLFSLNIIPNLRKIPPLSKHEKKEIEKNYKFDVLTCPHCGSINETSNTVMIMQTSFKNSLHPFLDEIQREIKICLENTKHLILLGYSFPPDDLIWDTILNSKKVFIKNQNIYCSVVVGYKGEKKWLKGKQLSRYIELNKNKTEGYGVPTIIKMREIFGENKIRAFTGGIPDVWIMNNNFKKNILNLLYPEPLFSFPLKRTYIR